MGTVENRKEKPGVGAGLEAFEKEMSAIAEEYLGEKDTEEKNVDERELREMFEPVEDDDGCEALFKNPEWNE